MNPTNPTNPETFDERELHLLQELEREPDVTQRALARRLEVALGVTNMLLRRLVARGYVRATRASWRGWAYTLTPAGAARKVRLVQGYVRRVLGRYRAVREELARELEASGLDGTARVAIYCPVRGEPAGAAGGLDRDTRDVAELVYLALKDCGVEEIDLVGSPGATGARIAGIPVRPLTAPATPGPTNPRNPMNSINPTNPTNSMNSINPRDPTNSRNPYDWVVVASLEEAGGPVRELEAAGVVPGSVLTPLCPRG